MPNKIVDVQSLHDDDDGVLGLLKIVWPRRRVNTQRSRARIRTTRTEATARAFLRLCNYNGETPLRSLAVAPSRATDLYAGCFQEARGNPMSDRNCETKPIAK